MDARRIRSMVLSTSFERIWDTTMRIRIKGRKGELVLAQFCRSKGLCLQIMRNPPETPVELDKKQVQELVKELQNWLGETEFPSFNTFMLKRAHPPVKK